MPVTDLEPFLRTVERRAAVMVLRNHPEWTLGQVLRHLGRAGPRAAVLSDLTLGELLSGPDLDPLMQARDGGPPIDLARLKAAKRLEGAQFDSCVHEVISAAGAQPVRAAYLRARVGGPRWKLQSALRRLVTAGLIVRTGVTSSTRYRISRRADA